ncbi:MAG: hypothetical protein C0621_09830, partial [Desulfuromonas sp.]
MGTRILSFALMSLLYFSLASASFARDVHYFDCQTCHRSGQGVTGLAGNICLTCHRTGSTASTGLNDQTSATPIGALATGDASDAMGNNPSVSGATSHAWGVPDDAPDAGAQAPTDSVFYNSYQISLGVVSCARCHDPHGSLDTNPTLAKLDATLDDACLDCHTPWNQANANAYLTHPVGASTLYSGFSADSRFKAAVDNSGTAHGDVRLVGGMVSCTSCHAPHYADSDANTRISKQETDIANPDYQTGLNTGDGYLLRSDGPGRANKSRLCQACHTYQAHGNGGETVGCLVCHSGHSYNSGSPNYFVLRDDAVTSGHGAVSGLLFLDPTTDHGGSKTVAQVWSGESAGDTAGYCEQCHGQLTAMPGSARPHNEGENCRTCHQHDGATYAFEAAGGCDGCHGYAPTTNTQGGTTGYAYADASHDYSLDADFKDESLTGHAKHASTGNYGISCTECHSNYGVGGHPNLDNNYQDVAFVGGIAEIGMAPTAYDKAGAGTCATIYCHSDGVNPDRVVAGPNAATVPNWLGCSTTCTSCHTTGTTGTATVHNTHTALTLGGVAVDCGTCHADTWINATTVDMAGGAHVDGDVDVVFNTALTPTNPMDQVNGTCAVYCHSNGTTHVQAPDWDDVNTGNCGDCHDADGVTGDSVAISTGAHTTHLNKGLACSDCHTHDGSAFGGDHINGTFDVVVDVCLGCHGATSGVSAGVDREPIWTDPASVECRTCHTGVLATITNVAPSKDSFDVEGHGDAALTSAPDCTGCHDTSPATHFDGVSGNTDLLTGGATADDAFCNTCHASQHSHYTTAGSSTDGSTCAQCHEPHGDNMGTNTDAMLAIGSGFVDRTAASSYFNGSNNGVCQVCHDAAEGNGGIAHYNQTDAPDGHNDAQKCVDCHLHTDSPSFQFTAGTNCGDCHAYAVGTTQGALTSGAHQAHITVADGAIGNEDFTDCAQCHGATVTTYNYASGGNHMNGTTDFVGGLGYDDNGTRGVLGDDLVTSCAGACHATAAGQAALWTDASLSCDACHGNAPADGGGDTLAHSKHMALTSVDCDTCHGSIPSAGDTTHIDDYSGTEGAILADRGVADADEATLTESSWDDVNNTCNNATCHDPSGSAYLADWDTDTSDCNLCHGNAPATGAHDAHTTVSGNTTSEDRTDCAQCHTGA